MKNLQLSALQDISAESGVVCSIIANPEMYNLAEFLHASHFSQRELGAIYYVCGELIKSGVYQLDAFNIEVQVNSNNGIKNIVDKFGGTRFIKELVENAPIVARKTFEEYKLTAKQVSELGFRRELYKQLKSFENDAFDIEKPLSEINSKIITDLDLLAEKYVSNDNSPMFNEKVDSLIAELEFDRKRSNQGILGLPWSIPIINQTIGGLVDGDLYLIAGRRKSMKSVWSLNEAIHKAEMGLSVLMTSTEMSDKKDFLRALSIKSGIPIDDLKVGNIQGHSEQKYLDAIHFFKHAKFHREYDPNWTTEKLIMKAKQVKHKMGLDIMIHDYIKDTTTDGSAEKSNAMGRQCNDLKNKIAGGFNIPVIAPVQLNRGLQISDSDKLEMYSTACLKLLKKDREKIAEDGVECGNLMVQIPFARDGHSLKDEEDYIDLYADLSHTSNLRIYGAKKQHDDAVPEFLEDNK